MSASAERELGRAKNAVLQLLQKQLIVPKIYFETEWEGRHVDLLAIDRDGVGDVHVVEIKRLHATLDHPAIDEAVDQLRAVPAQYKYLAVLDSTFPSGTYRNLLTSEQKEQLFSEDGIGRVGLINFSLDDEGKPTAHLLIVPERFRAFVNTAADTFVAKHQPDWEIRA